MPSNLSVLKKVWPTTSYAISSQRFPAFSITAVNSSTEVDLNDRMAMVSNFHASINSNGLSLENGKQSVTISQCELRVSVGHHFAVDGNLQNPCSILS
jgi:hypothetical protein